MRAERKHPDSRRRGFAMPVVLLLLLVVSLSLTSALMRHSAQQRAVQRRIAEYRLHHEMFGARAIVLQWLERTRAGELKELSQSDDGEPAFGFTIPGGSKIQAYLFDGQGSATLLYNDGLDEVAMQWYGQILSRIADRPDLTRQAGPPQISLNAAPDDLIRAVFGDDLERAADRLIRTRARNRETLSRTDITEALQVANADPEQIRAITGVTTTNPLIWRVRIDTDDSEVQRQFEMLVEISDGKPMMLAWQEILPNQDQDSEGTEEDSGASRSRRTR